MDISKKSNKRSLFGFVGFIITLVILSFLGIDGIIKLVLAIIVWLLVYKIIDSKEK